MESTLWDVITCNTPAIKNDFNLVEPDSDEANELDQQGELFPIPGGKGLSAKDVIQYVCDILLKFPNFELGEAGDLSAGMLVQYDDAESPLTSGVVYDILLPNLYCVLALEAIGQQKPQGEFSNLKDIIKNEGKADLSNVSRSLSKDFPPGLKELFTVHRENAKKGSQYQIGTQFPELFCAELIGIRSSPTSEVESTRNSLLHSRRFYDKCIQAIIRTGTWSERSFAEYYLFERTFRLNTKLNLCYAKYQAKSVKSALSPKLLGDFLFHSPLVIFPKEMLLHLFYEGETDSDNHRKSMQFLHFLIQLSSVWFPQVLNVLRVYMEAHNIQSFEGVNGFFFSESMDFTNFQATYTPTLDDQVGEPRTLISLYSDRWSVFAPDSGYSAKSFTPYSLEDWRLKTASEYSDPADYHALREIQNTIPQPPENGYSSVLWGYFIMPGNSGSYHIGGCNILQSNFAKRYLDLIENMQYYNAADHIGGKNAKECIIMIDPSYKPTPLMERISKLQGYSSAFAIANFGDGPILSYRKRKTRVSLLSISISNTTQHIELSQCSTPPYLIALAQEKPRQPILTALYLAAQDPVLAQSAEHRLTGQVFAYGQSPDGSCCTIAHALYRSEHSHLFASADRYNSLLLERHPDLCSHLLLCGEMIDSLLNEKRNGTIYAA